MTHLFTKKHFAFLLILLISMQSCKKEKVTPTSPIGPTTPTSSPLYSGESIQTSIAGTIVDENNQPVSSALVSIGTESTYTNSIGVFFFTDISVDSKRAYIKAKKDGYFLGSRAIQPNSAVNNHIRIKLIPSSTVGSISNNLGGSVNIPGGASILFEPNDVSLEDGTPYSGDVNVHAYYLDPSSPEINQIMPGDMQAVNENNEGVILESYGMLAVELTGNNGEALNITPGATVSLSFPIQSNQIGSAPSSIPLWYFNETDGNWVEEGTATLNGNNYEGEVSHFSFWNSSTPSNLRDFHCQLESNSFPLKGIQVRMLLPNGNHSKTIYTNSNGEIYAQILANTDMTMEVVNTCGTVIHTENISAGTSAVDFSNLQVSSSSLTMVSATLLDCNNQPVTNGCLNITYPNGITFNLFTNSNGQVNTAFSFCSQITLTFTAYDLNTSLQSTTMTATTGPNIDLGNINTCDPLDEYIYYTLDGNQYEIEETGQYEVSSYLPTNIIDSTTVLGSSNGNYIRIRTPLAQLGSNPNSKLSEISGYYIQWPNNTINVEYTTLGAATGSYNEGTFDGTFTDTQGVTHTLNGSFRSKIQD